MFEADQIRAATFVRHVEVHDTLGSTNDRAAYLARQANIELPALVIARIQTAGRGRGKNIWWSAEGALTFSLLLDSKSAGIFPEKWPQLSLTTAVSVCDALSAELHASSKRAGSSTSPARSPRVGIKWPNDVLIDGKKICGILIESPGGAAPEKDRLIIGIGININNSLHIHFNHGTANGLALCDVTAQQHDLQKVLIATLAAFETRLDQLRAGDASLIHAWRALDQLCNKELIVESGTERIEGMGEQLGEDGALVVSTVFGLMRFYSGSVLMK